MNTSFSIQIDIDALPQRVWEVMIDIERWSEWTPSVKQIRRLDKGPIAVGSRALIRQPRLLPAVWKMKSIEPNRSFSWATGFPGLFSVVGIHSVEARNKGSHAVLALTFSGALGGVVARLTKTLNERYLALEAQGLKRRSEVGLTAAFPFEGSSSVRGGRGV